MKNNLDDIKFETNTLNTIKKMINLTQGMILVTGPTGSGKTVIVSQVLKNLVRDRKDEKTFSFIWVSVRMLHEQSKEKLEKYYTTYT